MAQPTTSEFWNQTTPAAPTGDQNAVIQSDGATPMQSITVMPKRATSTLHGTVKIDDLQQEAFTYAADTGSANAYAVALSPTPTIVAGSVVVFKAANVCAGASTLAVNGGSAQSLVKDGNIPLETGDIAVGQIVSCVYDGINWQAIGLAPSPGSLPISLIQSGVASVANSSPISLAFSSSNTAANCLVIDVIGIQPLYVGGYGISDSLGNTYTLVNSRVSNNIQYLTYVVENCLAGANTVSFAFTALFSPNTTILMAIHEYSNVLTASAVDSSGTDTGVGNTFPLTPSLTTTTAGDLMHLVAGCAYVATAGTLTQTGGYTARQSGSVSASISLNIATWDHQSAAPGTYSNQVNQSGVSSPGFPCAILIALKQKSTSIGSVTSVALAVPSRQTVSGSPITGAGTLTVTDNVQNANMVFSGPSSGSAAAPTFRALVSADVPGSLSNPMTTVGDIIYGGSSGTPTRLAPGTSGNLLQTNGAGAAPSWVTPSGGGGVSLDDIPLGIPGSLPTSGNGQLYLNLTEINQVPVMTSNTAPSGTASASASYGANPPWWAFGAFGVGGIDGWVNNGGTTGWLQYQFTAAVTITSYSVTPWSVNTFPSRSPTAWTLEGSNDGTTWTTLDTQTFSAWVISTAAPFTVGSPGSYAYYRLNITANGGDSYTALQNLSLKNTTGSSTLALFIRDSSGNTQQVQSSPA